MPEGQGEEAHSHLHGSVASLHFQKEQLPSPSSQALEGHHSQICNLAFGPSCDLRELHKAPESWASSVLLTPQQEQEERREQLFLPLVELWIFLKS